MLNCDRSTVKIALQNTQNDCYQLTALECTKFDFGRSFAPDPAGGAYSWFRGLLLRGGEGKGRERRGGDGGETVGEGQGTGNGRGRDARERGGKGRKERRGREEK